MTTEPNYTDAQIEQRVRECETTPKLAGAIAQPVSVPDGDMPETKWFVMTGNNEEETPILLFSSRYFAEQYCAKNPSSRGYRIYKATPAAPKREGE